MWWFVRECYELLGDDKFFLKGDEEFFWYFGDERLLFFILEFVFIVWIEFGIKIEMKNY